MSEPTTATATKAAKAASSSSNSVASTLPSVVETVEVAVEVPAKVVFNQRLIVIAAVVGGAALGAGVLYGVQRFCGRKTVVVVPDTIEDSANNA